MSSYSAIDSGESFDVYERLAIRNRYLRRILLDSPLAIWPGQDASGNPEDVSGNGLDMTAVAGTPDYGQVGPMDANAIRLGGGESVSRAIVSSETDTFTMEILAKLEAISGDYQTLFYNGNSGANGYGLVIGLSGSSAVFPLLGGVVLGASNGAALSGGWDYVVLRRRGDGLWQHRVNGTWYDPSIGTGGGNVPAGDTVIGGSASFQFAFAYAAFYSTALSDATIDDHYAAFLDTVPLTLIPA